MVCWFQVNLSGMVQLVHHSLQPGGRSWDSKLHHDPITRNHNIVNIEHGKQVEHDRGGFAQGCSNLS